MKIFNWTLTTAITVVSFVLLSNLFGLSAAHAATSPTLSDSSSYSILAGSTVTNTGTTTVSGDLGVSPGSAVTGSPTVSGTIHLADSNAALAQIDNSSAFDDLDQTCTTDYSGEGIKDLTLLSPLAPGVYCADAFILTGNLSLTGSGVWIFKSASTLITSPGSSVTGGDPCNVWWRVASSATLDTTTAFKGNILALTDINIYTGATLNGRAMAQTGQVVLQGNTISGPVCAALPPASGGTSAIYTGTINVVKTVINDNGGTKTVADFPLFIGSTSVVSGVTNKFSFSSTSLYVVSETVDPDYTQTFSGDCDDEGILYLEPNENLFCIITNDDIGSPVVVPPVPPIIDVVKVPSPLILPDGPGSVTYTYTLRNVGTVPVTDITMVGDTCYPITLTSGDLNNDSKLDVNETWVHNCTKTISETHTNTVVATGWANGLSATDIASATVFVNEAIVPPLIHVTKVPSPLTLLAGGGNVTYTETITNPGTEPLNNVTLTDDKCSPMVYVSGDTNSDSKLDTSESWKYTCQTKLTATTTNTATASGEANGITVRDIALATVTVAAAVPTLPATGFLNSISFSGIVVLISLLVLGFSPLLFFKKHKS